MQQFTGVKQAVQSGKMELARLYQNPNTRFALIGLVCAFVIVGVTFFALRTLGKESSVEDFMQRWKTAVESKQPETYQALWDETARAENWHQYERALKLLKKEKVEANIEGIRPRADLRDERRTLVERVPVTIHQDGEILVTLFRNVTVEKKGLMKRWKLVGDEILDEMEYPEATEEPIVQEPAIAPDSASMTGNTRLTNPSSAGGGSTTSGNLPSPFGDSKVQVTPPDATSPIAGSAPLDAKLKVSQVLGIWQEAWQSKDLEAYLRQYAEDAEIIRVSVQGGKEYPTKLNKAQLRQKMIELNQRYNTIRVKISNLQINGDNAVADVDFLQEFIGTPASGDRPAYSDFGAKTLIFMVDPADGHWKIYSESWKLYKDVPKYPKL